MNIDGPQLRGDEAADGVGEIFIAGGAQGTHGRNWREPLAEPGDATAFLIDSNQHRPSCPLLNVITQTSYLLRRFDIAREERNDTHPPIEQLTQRRCDDFAIEANGKHFRDGAID